MAAVVFTQSSADVCPWVSDMAFLSLQNGNSLYQAQAKHFLCVN